MRRQGLDLHELDRGTEQLMALIHENLPDPPVSTTARFATLRSRPSDGVDRISGLSDSVLSHIVSRLLVKEAARTAVLAVRWRGVWRSTPLMLIDTQLISNGRSPARASTPDSTAAVSRMLAAHTGPFRCVHITCSRVGADQSQLKRWISLLAARGVQDLVLVNRPWPREVPLPKTLFTISTLTRLYIGLWKFPDAAGLQGASFPHLRELGICSVTVENGDIEAVVARSTALEILNIQGNMRGVRLRLVSHSLRCVQICSFVMDSIDVVNAPCLERLIVSNCLNPAGGSSTKIKIDNATKMSVFGYLEPGKYSLMIQDTVITDGIKLAGSMIVTSVKVLSLRVRFGVYDDVKMVPAFLRCFPNVEALHMTSEKCDHLTGKFDLKFWEEVGPILSVLLRLKVITFREYRARQDEIAFLQYIFQNARVLKNAMIQKIYPRFISLSEDEMDDTITNMPDEKWACQFDLAVGKSSGPEGLSPGLFSEEQTFPTTTLSHRLNSSQWM